jgi:hypothetical protein
MSARSVFRCIGAGAGALPQRGFNGTCLDNRTSQSTDKKGDAIEAYPRDALHLDMETRPSRICPSQRLRRYGRSVW